MIKLYHGSNVAIEKIDLSRGRRGKDFGRGFYLSADYKQAKKMAEMTVDREESGIPTVTAFLFDESVMVQNGELKIKIFKDYSIDWAEFVMMNRRNRTDHQAHDFDIIFGPIADDRVGLQIRRFHQHYISMNELVRQLTFIRPTFQYFIGTERAVTLLTPITDNHE